MTYTIIPTGTEKYDLLQLFSNRRSLIRKNILNELQRLRSMKWYAVVKANLTKYDDNGGIKDCTSPTFRSVTEVVMDVDSVPGQIDSAFFKISENLEKWKRDSSGWRPDEIQYLEQTSIQYNPLRGSCSLYELLSALKRKACLLSVTGPPADNSFECFAGRY